MNKKITALFMAGIMIFSAMHFAAVGAAEDTRNDTVTVTASGRTGESVMNLNVGWRFGGLDETDAAAKPGYDDSAWEDVDIPHTWNAEDAQDGGGNYRRASYWYRKDLNIDGSLLKKHLFLEFLGVSQKAEVYVNGERAEIKGSGDTHKGAYTAFRCDVTELLREGSNVIAVKADNRRDQEIAPVSGDFNIYGGIYRDVNLVATDDVHVDLGDYGSSGFYITTHGVRSYERPETLGDTNIRANVVNDSDDEKTVTVTATIKGDNAPKPVSEIMTIPAGGSAEFNCDMRVEDPHLWNGIDYSEEADKSDVGYMYEVELVISENGVVLDTVSDTVGYRYFWIDKDTGFYLNGESHPLHGVNRHQETKGLGNAIGMEEHERDIEIMKEMGVNAVRLCHYPQSDMFYDLCDKNGIIVWTEIPLVNELGDAQGFADVTKLQLKELIRQQYNRPSVCMWGLENEVGNGDAQNSFMNMKQLIYELDALAKEEDPSGRYTTQAINRDYAMDQYGTADFDDFSNNEGWKSDIAAWNIYPGWYNDKNFTGTFEGVMDRKKAQDSRPMAISEYGWGANPYQHELYPELNKNGLTAGGRWHPEEYQSMMHEDAMAYINSHPELWGVFIWVMFDFSVDSRNEGSQAALNDKGMVTDDRAVKKDSFYLYKANWNEADKFAHITSKRYTERDNSDTYIKVYSNCDEVELFLNGESLGNMENAGNGVFIFEDAKLGVGDNAVRVTGKSGDVTVEDSCVWQREISSTASLGSEILKVDDEKHSVTLSETITLSELRECLYGVNNSVYTVWSGGDEITDGAAEIVPGMRIKVTAEDGVSTAEYVFVSPHICSGKYIYATSNEEGNIPENATDGKETTRWVAVDSSYPQSITMDLGGKYYMGGLILNWYAEKDRYYSYEVQISDDGEEFTTVLDRTDNTLSGEITESLRGAQGRYLRIYVKGCSNRSGYAALYEIELNGWNMNSDVYDIDHGNRTVTVPETGDAAGLTPEKLLENLTIQGNCTYAVNTRTAYVNDGDTLDITDADGVVTTYTICTPESEKAAVTDLALLRPVYASSEEGTATTGEATVNENVNDSDMTTRWTADTQGGEEAKYPEWIGVDLGEVCDLSRAELYFETKSNRTYSYNIYVSENTAPSDGSSDIPEGYEKIAEVADGASVGMNTAELDGVKGRYVIVEVTGCSAWSENAKYVAASLFELKIFGRRGAEEESPSPEPEESEKPEASPSPEPTESEKPEASPSPEPTDSPGESCVKITVDYGENGALESVSIEYVSLSEVSYEESSAGRKVFYWESMENMVPVEVRR